MSIQHSSQNYDCNSDQVLSLLVLVQVNMVVMFSQVIEIFRFVCFLLTLENYTKISIPDSSAANYFCCMHYEKDVFPYHRDFEKYALPPHSSSRSPKFHKKEPVSLIESLNKVGRQARESVPLLRRICATGCEFHRESRAAAVPTRRLSHGIGRGAVQYAEGKSREAREVANK